MLAIKIHRDSWHWRFMQFTGVRTYHVSDTCAYVRQFLLSILKVLGGILALLLLSIAIGPMMMLAVIGFLVLPFDILSSLLFDVYLFKDISEYLISTWLVTSGLIKPEMFESHVFVVFGMILSIGVYPPLVVWFKRIHENKFNIQIHAPDAVIGIQDIIKTKFIDKICVPIDFVK